MTLRSISLAIVRAHGGQIDYELREPHGARFRFRLPVNGTRTAQRMFSAGG